MDQFEKIVNETLLSGIAPLQQHYVGIFDGYGECPIAYRSYTDLFTASTGVIEESRGKIDQKAIGARISIRNVVHGIRTMQNLIDQGRTTKWISVEASTSLLMEEDLFTSLDEVLKKESFSQTEKICLMFSPSVMKVESELVRKGMADIKALGLKIALGPITKEFALSSIMDLPIDVVVLASELTLLATDRNKPGVLGAMIALLHTMGVSVVAEGVENDDQIRELTTVECFGFIPTLSYRGEFLLPLGKRTEEEIEKDEESV